METTLDLNDFVTGPRNFSRYISRQKERFLIYFQDESHHLYYTVQLIHLETANSSVSPFNRKSLTYEGLLEANVLVLVTGFASVGSALSPSVVSPPSPFFLCPPGLLFGVEFLPNITNASFSGYTVSPTSGKHT